MIVAWTTTAASAVTNAVRQRRRRRAADELTRESERLGLYDSTRERMDLDAVRPRRCTCERSSKGTITWWNPACPRHDGVTPSGRLPDGTVADPGPDGTW